MRATSWSRRRGVRKPLGAVATLLAIAVVAAIAALFLPPEAFLSGRAMAIDGDTLRVGETRIRLLGLDAVELDQTCVDASAAQWPCGREARSFLAALTKGETTTCASA